MSGRNILFLDLASVTGWAEGEPGGRAASGRVVLGAKGDPASIGRGLNGFLAPRLAAFKPARVIYESPYISNIQNQNVTMITWGLAFMTETICSMYGVRCQKANLNSIRKLVLGRVPRGKDVDVKGIVGAHVRSLGYEPEDDNAADAILGWLYSCAVLDPAAGSLSQQRF